MSGLSNKSFDRSDERRTPPLTQVDVVQLDGATAARLTLQPGWRWSECIKPTAGTGSCRAKHLGAVISGRLHVKHDDGSEATLGPGEAYVISSGHDAWVVGDEPAVAVEFDTQAAQTYAASE